MNGKVLVVIPSRDRPVHAYSAMCSAHSPQSDVLIYVDDDQRDPYKDLIECHGEDRGWCVVGPRVGPVAAVNQVIADHPDYAAYGMITDDSSITTKGWAEWLLEQPEMVVSPATTEGEHVDMPFVKAEWVKRLGWFAYPGCYHTGWPTITGVLAEAAGTLCKAPSDKFFVQHDVLPSQNQEHLREDARQLYAFFQMRFSTALGLLRT